MYRLVNLMEPRSIDAELVSNLCILQSPQRLFIVSLELLSIALGLLSVPLGLAQLPGKLLHLLLHAKPPACRSFIYLSKGLVHSQCLQASADAMQARKSCWFGI